MRILYDGLIYLTQTAGGINRYFANIIERLPSNDTPVLATPNIRDINFPTHPNLKVVAPGTLRPRLLNLATLPIRMRMAERGLQPAIVHPTYYTLLTLQPVRRIKAPTVITVWDMTHTRFQHDLDRWGMHARVMKKAVMGADAVLCISENTRRDLLDRWNVPEDRIRVTPLATNLNATMVGPDASLPARPFLLFVGSRATYKNFSLALDAVKALSADSSELALCVVGAPLLPHELKEIEERGIRDRVIGAGHVDDPTLAALYAHALALIYPSHYEGFGIPPLEAMACGGVAITSNTSSIPEVVGNAAIQCNPDSLDEFVEAIRSVRDNPSLRTELVQRGRTQAELFSWERTARETFSVYEALT